MTLNIFKTTDDQRETYSMFIVQPVVLNYK